MKLLLSCMLFLLCSVNINSYATSTKKTGEGITFEEKLSWKQILEKAKKEHKFIFVDCFTTWCGPCKKMERDVYPQPEVGQVFNSNFICVKMQIDTSKVDNEDIKNHYADAQFISKQYKIDAYPTYLFFMPDGKLINRSTGLQEPERFIALAKETIDPNKNYYSLLELFKKGKLNSEQTVWLTNKASILGDEGTANEIARLYLVKMPNDSMFIKENIEIIKKLTKTSSDRGFQFFYQQSDVIDSIMSTLDYSKTIVSSIIYKEMVEPELSASKMLHTEPDWNKINSVVKSKYDPYYGERMVLSAKLSWTDTPKNPDYIKNLVNYFDKYGPAESEKGEMISFELNQVAWQVFLSSNNKE